MSQSRFHALLGKLFRTRPAVRRPPRERRIHLALEPLEDRITPQVTVTGTTSLNAGDRFLVVATLMTSDTNENGEGESLQIMAAVTGSGASGAVIGNDTNYNTTFVLDQVATQPETISASLSGEDGDESGTVNVSVISGRSKFTDQEKMAFARLSIQKGREATTDGLAAAGYGFASLVTGTAGGVTIETGIGGAILLSASVHLGGAALFYGVKAYQDGMAASDYADLNLDPPDPNFTTVAQPVIQPIILSIPNDPSAASELAPLQAFIDNGQTELGVLQALNTAVNRASGAEQAGDTASLALQEQAINLFSTELANALAAEPALLAAAQSDLAALGLPSQTATPAQVQSYEQNVQQNGLAPLLQQLLTLGGATPAEITTLTNQTFVQDINAAAGDPIALLTNPADISELQTDAAVFSTGVTPGPYLYFYSPNPPTTNAPTGLSPQENFVQGLYENDLGRVGQQPELDYWVGLLNAPGGSQAAVASAIQHTAESQDHLVKGWYEAYLGRQALGGEEMGWVNLLQQGQSQQQVLSQILGTAEFFNDAQSLVTTGTPQQNYVQALYLLLLNRTGGASEISYWTDTVLPQLGQQGVAQALLSTAEFRMDLFAGDYTTLLGRPADAAGLNFWTFSGLDLATVRLQIESTPEFFTNG